MKAEPRRTPPVGKHKAHERRFLPLIEAGIFSIDSNGAIWRHAVRHLRRDAWVPVTARRAENDAGDYLQITQTINGERLICQANRLVWQHFNGIISDGMEVNHEDGSKKNNHPDNLTLLTRSENMVHAFSSGLHHGVWGEHHKCCLHADDLARKCIALRECDGLTITAIASETGISKSQVFRIVSGQSRRGVAS